VLFLTAGWGRATCGSTTVGNYEPGSCIGGREVAAHLTNPVTVTAETLVTVRAASAREFRSLGDIPAIAGLAGVPPLLHDAPADTLDPAPTGDREPHVADPERLTWEPANWLAFAVADDDWPAFAAAVDGARAFWAAARIDPGGFGA
jgi:hypothetical protein